MEVEAKKVRPPLVCVCVTLGIIGILLDLLSLLSYFPVFVTAGGPGILLLTWSNKARQQDGILELATPAYLHFFPNGMRLSPEPHR